MKFVKFFECDISLRKQMKSKTQVIDFKWGIKVLLALFLYFIELLYGIEMILFSGQYDESLLILFWDLDVLYDIDEAMWS